MAASDPLRCIVMGAAGRDFHDFRTFFAARPAFRVVAFTAEQIPFIETRSYPAALAPEGYDEDIPIHPERALPRLVRELDVDLVLLAYSDLAHEEVMHKASIAQAAGASFLLLGPKHTELRSRLPVIAVTAVRTGAGKSPIAQALARHLAGRGVRAGVVRHPMPYGDLRRQAVQRFATPADLDAQECTVEEREEYEPYVEAGLTVFAGVDYAAILEAAEAESDLILWDGGNNDRPFFAADLQIVVADALRAGHETRFYPGETNARRADVWGVNKVDAAAPEDVSAVREAAATLCPGATVLEAGLALEYDAEAMAGRRVVVVEDGPTLTHGGMAFGAGTLAAKEAGAVIVDPRPHAVGTLAEAFARFPHLGPVLPALGYSPAQREELAATLRAAQPDLVVDASPASLQHLLALDDLPFARVRYRFAQRSGPDLFALVDVFCAR